MFKFKKGDKVSLKGREEVTGTVIDMRRDSMWSIDFAEYYIKYDKTDLIPPEDWHDEDHLQHATKLPMGGATSLLCQCGVSKVMPNGKHSDYCPLYRKY